MTRIMFKGKRERIDGWNIRSTSSSEPERLSFSFAWEGRRTLNKSFFLYKKLTKRQFIWMSRQGWSAWSGKTMVVLWINFEGVLMSKIGNDWYSKLISFKLNDSISLSPKHTDIHSLCLRWTLCTFSQSLKLHSNRKRLNCVTTKWLLLPVPEIE